MGLWGAFYKKEMYEEALSQAKTFFTVLGDHELNHVLQDGSTETGYRRAMKQAGNILAARSARTHVPAVRVARLYAHAGEPARTLEWLEKAYDRRETPLGHLAVAWDWGDLHRHPQFQDLLRRVKLSR